MYTNTDLCKVWMWAGDKGGDCGQILFDVDSVEDVCPCLGLAVYETILFQGSYAKGVTSSVVDVTPKVL